MEGYREGECLMRMSDAATRAVLDESYVVRGALVEKTCQAVELVGHVSCPVSAIGRIGRRGFDFREAGHCMGYLPPLPPPMPSPPEEIWRAEYQDFLADQPLLD
jgi:hypothetical protein